MSKRVSFKLRGYEAEMALALQNQLAAEGKVLSLDTIVERMFVNWMYNNVLRENDNAPVETSGVPSGSETEVPVAGAGDALQVNENV